MITPVGGDTAASQLPTPHPVGHGQPRTDPAAADPFAVGREADLAMPSPRTVGPRRERSHRWDLVVLELGCPSPEDGYDGIGLLGADLLAPAGVLAVLTHSERRGGRLTDPTGSVVASAQAADLLYLQHIVLLTAPLGATPTDTRPAAEPGAGRSSTGTRHRVEGIASEGESPAGDDVIDLLLFLQPGDPGQSSAPEDLPAVDPPDGARGTTQVPDLPQGAARRVVNGDRA